MMVLARSLFVIAVAVLIFPAVARLVGAAVLVLLVLAVAHAESGPNHPENGLNHPRRPLPMPQVGAGCPSGYTSSPTSGTCTPSIGMRCRAFPSTGGCPVGWSYSPTSRMCVETNCR
jgi:hypothetical protein